MKMNDPNDIPDTVIEQVAMVEGILTDVATGGPKDSKIYVCLRRDFMADPVIRDLIPTFVRTCQNLGTFWAYIKKQSDTYDGRREIISMAFTPLMDHLEQRHNTPGDKIVSDTLEIFDRDGVHIISEKALERRRRDPEGAITVARTLLETVSKRILDEMGESYSEKDDLPKLYSIVAKAMNLAPNQHTEEPIKAILGSAMNVANGIGTLRNRLSDSHGRGGKLPVRPSPRHASLAVNMSGTIAAFLVETFHERQSQA